MTPRLNVITASTRPGRVGPVFADWIATLAREEGSFDVHEVDLAELGLPVFDEPNHPRTGDYVNAHTRAWSTSVDAADAFVFVTPEYNYATPPSLLNALTYLSREWGYKPAGFVSYGGVTGGMRSVGMTKQVLDTLRVVSIPEGVPIPLFFEHVKDGRFDAKEVHVTGARAMLAELHRWAVALRPMRG